MGTLITNKLVTLGLGTSRGIEGRGGLVVAGYGGPPSFVVSALEERTRIRVGQSGSKRRLDQLDEVIVWAKLLEVNGKAATGNVKGALKVRVDKKRGHASVVAEHISSRARGAWEFIKVSVRRLK